VSRRACAAALAAVVAAAAGAGAGNATAATSAPVASTPASTSAGETHTFSTTTGGLAGSFSPETGASRLTSDAAVRLFLAHPKVARWLERYPPKPQTEGTFDTATRAWTVKVWSGKAGEIALGKVDDATGRVTQAFTGPQVAWSMARGRVGSFGGKVLNSWWMWVSLSAAFFIGLVDRRRLLSWHTLDLLALLSFGFSLWAFNQGHVFKSGSLGALPLAYLVVRTSWIGFRGRSFDPRLSWPVWLLAAAAVFLGGLRIGLNLESPRGVIDVGYAGVIGADRILDGESPYGHMPVENTQRACGTADADGEVRDWVQANGRCESANPRGDTYGPVNYLAYVPFTLTLIWSGKWDSLPAAHATSIAFDLLTVLGLLLVGRRFGGPPLAIALAFAWFSFPFTAYTLNANSNDAIMPAFLVWGLWLCTSSFARGAGVALSAWTKFATLLLAPLWLTYPRGLRRRTAAGFAGGFVLATLAAFSILLFEPSLVDAVRTFFDRTVDYQFGRDSPFSPWDWGQYHAKGIPDLSAIQVALQIGLIALAGIAAVLPARKGPLELAALSAAILVGFELTLTHWSYLYIPWFLPFALLALMLPRRREVRNRPRPPVAEAELVASAPSVSEGAS
jgi:hypothetical protein